MSYTLNNDYPSFLKAVKKWGELPDQCNDYIVARNLALALIQRITVLENGDFELQVMTRGKEWRRGRDSNSR